MKSARSLRLNAKSENGTATPKKTKRTVATKATSKKKVLKPATVEPDESGLSSRSVGEDESVSEHAVAQEYTNEPDRIRARHTLRLEQIYRKAIIGHAQSCEDERTEKRTAQGDGAASESSATKTTKRADAAKYKVESTRRVRAGDIRYLTEARQALGEIRRIWGIDSAPSSNERLDDSLSNITFEAASEADLALLEEAFQTLQKLTEGVDDESEVE